eukprot:TRINITY_DN2728_c0_g2_i1.p1 TRINITY_DN2728_c0_g2~~TRINITY_DN2728_c0_g2_i1.p1  ORF type:complete len:274 (+),score=-4.47 TRINITY_DN2728_c0_g2_i1:872-1693(+)
MVLNHAAQALANVKIEKRVSPLSCFFITVAESGERKTSVESITLQITQQYQARLEEKYKEDLSIYKKELFFYEAALKKIVASKEPVEMQKQKAQDLEEPVKPKNPVMVTSNPTMQGLMRGFEEGFPSILLASSEGGQFMGGYAMRQENQLNTLTALSSFWDGSPIDQMKKEGRLYTLRGRRLALHLGVQPSVFESFLRGRFVKDQGFCHAASSPYPGRSLTSGKPGLMLFLPQNHALPWRLMTKLCRFTKKSKVLVTTCPSRPSPLNRRVYIS